MKNALVIPLKKARFLIRKPMCQDSYFKMPRSWRVKAKSCVRNGIGYLLRDYPSPHSNYVTRTYELVMRIIPYIIKCFNIDLPKV